MGGLLGQRADRTVVVAAGCALWATTTALFGATSSLAAALPLWACNGAALALVVPNIQARRPSSRTKGKGVGRKVGQERVCLWSVLTKLPFG